MKVQVSKAGLFNQYLLWLDPMLNLTKVERNILSSLLTLHYHHKDKIKEPELSLTIISEDTLGNIKKRLRLSKKLFDEGIERLKQKGYLTDSGVAPMFTSYPKDGKFSISVEFEVK